MSSSSDVLDADQLAARVQEIIDDPTREVIETDERVLQALYARREAEAPPATAAGDDVVESTTSDEPEETASEEQQALDSAVSGAEMTDDRQVQYSRLSGQIIGAAGQPSRPAEPSRPRKSSGGRSRSRHG